MTKCDRCGRMRQFENISCRFCAKYDHDKMMAWANRDKWFDRVKHCEKCDGHATMIINDAYLCGSCHGLAQTIQA